MTRIEGGGAGGEIMPLESEEKIIHYYSQLFTSLLSSAGAPGAPARGARSRRPRRAHLGQRIRSALPARWSLSGYFFVFEISQFFSLKEKEQHRKESYKVRSNTHTIRLCCCAQLFFTKTPNQIIVTTLHAAVSHALANVYSFEFLRIVNNRVPRQNS